MNDICVDPFALVQDCDGDCRPGSSLGFTLRVEGLYPQHLVTLVALPDECRAAGTWPLGLPAALKAS